MSSASLAATISNTSPPAAASVLSGHRDSVTHLQLSSNNHAPSPLSPAATATSNSSSDGNGNGSAASSASLLLSSSADGSIRVWDLRASSKCVRCILTSAPTQSSCSSASSSECAQASFLGTDSFSVLALIQPRSSSSPSSYLQAYDLRCSSIIVRQPVVSSCESESPISSFTLSEENQRIYCGNDNGALEVFHFNTLEKLATVDSLHDNLISAVALDRRHSNYVWTGGYDCQMKFCQLPSLPTSSHSSLASSASATPLSVVSPPHLICTSVCKCTSPTAAASSGTNPPFVECVTTSPWDSSTVFSGLGSGEIFLWSLQQSAKKNLKKSATGEKNALEPLCYRRLFGHRASLLHLSCFVAERLASLASDRQFLVWDLSDNTNAASKKKRKEKTKTSQITTNRNGWTEEEKSVFDWKDIVLRFEVQEKPNHFALESDGQRLKIWIADISPEIKQYIL